MSGGASTTPAQPEAQRRAEPAPTRLPGFRRPRIGFAGVGWIGRNRMEAMARSGAIEVAALADPIDAAIAGAAADAPRALRFAEFDDLLSADLDGIVIATPSALHAGQAVAALERGIAVFCQKPLGRNAAETRRVVDAAHAADRLLGVDLSYRHLAATGHVAGLIRAGELGTIYGVDLVFHNAYGPDKGWFYDRSLSGGGCVIDLGVHLVDLALYCLDFPRVQRVASALFSRGRRITGRVESVEDYAIAALDLEGGTHVRLACSWKLPAGCDAVIEASFYGTNGGASIRNVGGSFYDFTAERFRGTSRERLCDPPDPWGGQAAVGWARRLFTSPRFDPQIARVVEVAEVLDGIYRT